MPSSRDEFRNADQIVVDEIEQNIPVTAVDTNTVWTTSVGVSPGPGTGYFRIKAAPVPAYSPPWTPQ